MISLRFQLLSRSLWLAAFSFLISIQVNGQEDLMKKLSNYDPGLNYFIELDYKESYHQLGMVFFDNGGKEARKVIFKDLVFEVPPLSTVEFHPVKPGIYPVQVWEGDSLCSEFDLELPNDFLRKENKDERGGMAAFVNVGQTHYLKFPFMYAFGGGYGINDDRLAGFISPQDHYFFVTYDQRYTLLQAPPRTKIGGWGNEKLWKVVRMDEYGARFPDRSLVGDLPGVSEEEKNEILDAYENVIEEYNMTLANWRTTRKLNKVTHALEQETPFWTNLPIRVDTSFSDHRPKIGGEIFDKIFELRYAYKRIISEEIEQTLAIPEIEEQDEGPYVRDLTQILIKNDQYYLIYKGRFENEIPVGSHYNNSSRIDWNPGHASYCEIAYSDGLPVYGKFREFKHYLEVHDTLRAFNGWPADTLGFAFHTERYHENGTLLCRCSIPDFDTANVASMVNKTLVCDYYDESGESISERDYLEQLAIDEFLYYKSLASVGGLKQFFFYVYKYPWLVWGAYLALFVLIWTGIRRNLVKAGADPRFGLTGFLIWLVALLTMFGYQIFNSDPAIVLNSWEIFIYFGMGHIGFTLLYWFGIRELLRM